MDETESGFAKAERLRKRKEFLAVYRHGQRLLSTDHVFYLRKNGLSCSRLGVTASRRTGSAVVRNRIKRRLREVFRANKRALHPPCDLVVNAKRSAAAASTESFYREFREAARYWQRISEKGPQSERK